MLFDTDVCIVYLRGRRNDAGALERAVRGELIGYCSAITYAELRTGAVSDQQLVQFHEMMTHLTLLPVRQPEADLAGAIRERLRHRTGIQLTDAIIAATAILADLPLRTNNTRHFVDVPGLTLAPRDGLHDDREA